MQISTLYLHSCGVRFDGTLACWGRNDVGQATPPSGNGFVQVAAGGIHSCALKADHSVVCWGSNVVGQSSPPATPFVRVHAGFSHSCGHRSDGGVECWGNNVYGQTSPLPAGAFTEISTGFFHTCGMRSNGKVLCWGDNQWGQALPPIGIRYVSPAEAIANLISAIEALQANVAPGTTKSMLAPLKNVSELLGDGNASNDGAACGKLDEMIATTEAKAASGKLGEQTATSYIQMAEAIKSDLGCP
jgi:alpha-tubulin suppressor-like RCC1 family protein